MTNIFKSVIGNIETLNSDIEVRILINGFHIIDAESMIPGYVIQIWSATDDHYPDGRILRQVAFDMDGNPYRFAANCGFTKFAPVPRDGYQYGGFTPLEMIELVRFRDWIISQFPSKGMKSNTHTRRRFIMKDKNNPNNFELTDEDIKAIESLHKALEEKKTKAILEKHQDPTWVQMMDHISLGFDSFQGIRGYWNIITNKWVVIMSDLSKAHELLRDAVSSIETIKIGYAWTEAQYNVAFEISNMCETVRVRKDYYGEHLEELTDEKVSSIEYRITQEIIPKIKAIVNEPYPYQDKPRILSNIPDIDIDKINEMSESEKYTSIGNGSFRYLVYRMKGMSSMDNMLSFEQWLEED